MHQLNVQVTVIDGMLLKVEDVLDLTFKDAKMPMEQRILQLQQANDVFQVFKLSSSYNTVHSLSSSWK